MHRFLRLVADDRCFSLHDGAGGIIISAMSGLVEAFEEYQMVLKRAKKAVHYREWDEVIPDCQARAG
jgi:hypothetical protein